MLLICPRTLLLDLEELGDAGCGPSGDTKDRPSKIPSSSFADFHRLEQKTAVWP